MNGKTNVAVVGFAAGLTTLIIWLVGYKWPDLIATAPAGLEAAITAIITTLVGIFTPSDVGKSMGFMGSRSPTIIGLLSLAIAILFLGTGCAGTQRAYQEADGLYETSQVMGEHYLALVTEMNNMANSGVLAGNELDVAQDVVRQASPLVLSLGDAAAAYNELRNAQNTVELQKAISQAAIAIANIVELVKSRRITLRPSSSLAIPIPPHLATLAYSERFVL